MTTAAVLHRKYVTESTGLQTTVILPIEDYNGLLEDLDDLAVTAEGNGKTAEAHQRRYFEIARGSEPWNVPPYRMSWSLADA